MAGKVRQPIDLPSLERYISQNVPEIKVPIEVKQFGFGQSNPTYQLTDSTKTSFVLRKKPPGKIISHTAHNVEREHRIINALGSRTSIPVPKTYCFCSDRSVIGTDFYIMQFLDGRIIEDPAMPEIASAEERTALWKEAVSVLGAFHSLVPDLVGLGKFGKQGQFYTRQLRTFRTLSEMQARVRDVESDEPVGKIPHFDEMVEYFEANQPVDRVSLIHGDFKIDNLVFHKTEPRIIGILDWEMSTIGHPLSDLANLVHPFLIASIPSALQMGAASGSFLPGAVPGLPTKAQIIEWYRHSSGWDPTNDLPWGESFAMYRNSVIMQGIAARQAVRQASSEKASWYAGLMRPFGEVAWELVRRVKESGWKPEDESEVGGGKRSQKEASKL